MAGLQVFSLVVAGEALWSITDKKSWLPKRLFIGILIWFCTAGLFLILVHRRFETGVVPEGMDLYQIFYVFRNPHHYLPAAFGQRNWVILTLLSFWVVSSGSSVSPDWAGSLLLLLSHWEYIVPVYK